MNCAFNQSSNLLSVISRFCALTKICKSASGNFRRLHGAHLCSVRDTLLWPPWPLRVLTLFPEGDWPHHLLCCRLKNPLWAFPGVEWAGQRGRKWVAVTRKWDSSLAVVLMFSHRPWGSSWKGGVLSLQIHGKMVQGMPQKVVEESWMEMEVWPPKMQDSIPIERMFSTCRIYNSSVHQPGFSSRPGLWLQIGFQRKIFLLHLQRPRTSALENYSLRGEIHKVSPVAQCRMCKYSSL